MSSEGLTSFPPFNLCLYMTSFTDGLLDISDPVSANLTRRSLKAPSRNWILKPGQSFSGNEPLIYPYVKQRLFALHRNTFFNPLVPQVSTKRSPYFNKPVAQTNKPQ